MEKGMRRYWEDFFAGFHQFPSRVRSGVAEAMILASEVRAFGIARH